MGTKRRTPLTLGIALCLLGAAVAAGPAAAGLLGWLARGWPVVVLLAGAASLAGFAARRRPASPAPGALMLVAGCALLAFTSTATSNPFEVYGRWWPALVGVIAVSEVVRYYTHRPELGPRPPIVTPGRLVLVAAVAATGLASARIAPAAPGMFAGAHVPAALMRVRDEIFGREFEFAPITATAALAPGATVDVANRYGDVRFESADGNEVEVLLTPRVRAYDRASAERVASRLRLDVRPGEGVVVRTNAGDLGRGVRPDLTVRVPKGASVHVAEQHGDVIASALDLAGGRLAIEAVHGDVSLDGVRAAVEVTGSNGDVSVSGGEGALTVRLPNADVRVDQHTGDVSLTGVDDVRIKGLTAARLALADVDHARVQISDVAGPSGAAGVTVAGRHTRFSVENVAGSLDARAAFGELTASRIAGDVTVAAEHVKVSIAGAGSVTVATSHGRVEVADASGTVDVRNSFGGIDVRLPPGREYAIDPVVSHGDVSVDSALVRAAGAAAVRLQTSYGDIVVRPSSHRPAEGDT